MIDAQSTGEIVAQAKGYYKDSGVDIDFKPGGPNASSPKLVASGTVPIAIAYMQGVVAARSRGVPVKAFAAGLQKAPVAYWTVRKDIRSVADFKGKTIGIQPGGEVLLQVLLEHAGLKLDDVTTRNVGASIVPLTSGKVDVVPQWVVDIGTVAPLLENPDGRHWLLYDNGLRQQSNVYIAREDTITKKKAMLAGVLEASARGWAYSYAHPDEAIDILLDQASGLNRRTQLLGLKATKPLMFDSLTRQQGWGTIDRDVWTEAINAYQRLGQLGSKINIDDVVNTDVLTASPNRIKQ